MDENISDTGKKPMEEAVEDRSARKNKNDRLFLLCIVGTFVLSIGMAMYVGYQEYLLSEQFNGLTMSLSRLELRIGAIERQQAEFQAKSVNAPAANEIESLSSRVSALEKRMTSSQAQKKAPTKSPKQSKRVAKKRY